MTETELNRQLATLLESDKTAGPGRRRLYRRMKRVEKTNRRLAIIQFSGYMPAIGFVKGGCEGGTLLHTGRYIKYPKGSKCQRRLKRASERMVRRYPDMPRKGNLYRRIFDYWWTLY